MEEHPPGVSDPESLVLRPCRRGEEIRAIGKVEDVAMPMQDACAGGETADDRVGWVEYLHCRKADLEPFPRFHPSAERARQELSAETDSQHRNVLPDRARQPVALDFQRWVAIELVDVHRPTHRQDTGDLAMVGKRVAGKGLDDFDGKLVAGVEDPVRALPGHMSEHQQQRRPGLHGSEANRATVAGMPRFRSIAVFRPELRPATMTGAQARGAVAIGALAVGAAAVGGFAIGRLSIKRLAVGQAAVGRLKVDEVEIGRLSVRDRTPEA